MFGFDAIELARIQFAFTVSFHIIFAAFSIGLASYERPPVAIVFWSFRIMVALGFAMLGLGAWALVAAYALVGATWLVMKADGPVRRAARRMAVWTGAATITLVSLITPFLNPVYLDRWFGFPNVLFTVLVPAAILGAVLVFIKDLREGRDIWPFAATVRCSFYPLSGWGSVFILLWCRHR